MKLSFKDKQQYTILTFKYNVRLQKIYSESFLKMIRKSIDIFVRSHNLNIRHLKLSPLKKFMLE